MRVLYALPAYEKPQLIRRPDTTETQTIISILFPHKRCSGAKVEGLIWQIYTLLIATSLFSTLALIDRLSYREARPCKIFYVTLFLGINVLVTFFNLTRSTLLISRSVLAELSLLLGVIYG